MPINVRSRGNNPALSDPGLSDLVVRRLSEAAKQILPSRRLDLAMIVNHRDAAEYALFVAGLPPLSSIKLYWPGCSLLDVSATAASVMIDVRNSTQPVDRAEQFRQSFAARRSPDLLEHLAIWLEVLEVSPANPTGTMAGMSLWMQGGVLWHLYAQQVICAASDHLAPEHQFIPRGMESDGHASTSGIPPRAGSRKDARSGRKPSAGLNGRRVGRGSNTPAKARRSG
jgi:hypothetical protein